MFPVAGPVQFIDSFGFPRLLGTGQQHWHEGCDVMSPMGTPLVAVEDGIVTKVGSNLLGGLSVKITGTSGYWYYYAHLSAFAPGLVQGSADHGRHAHRVRRQHRRRRRRTDPRPLRGPRAERQGARLVRPAQDGVAGPPAAAGPRWRRSGPPLGPSRPRHDRRVPRGFPDGRPVFADASKQPPADPNASGAVGAARARVAAGNPPLRAGRPHPSGRPVGRLPPPTRGRARRVSSSGHNGGVDLTADLDAPCPPERLFESIDDLGDYPQWLEIVQRAEPTESHPDDDGDAAWLVDLRGPASGPLARSKRLRMVRTTLRRTEPGALRAARARRAAARRLGARGRVVPDAEVARLEMRLHYGGAFGGPVLERLLGDAIDRSRPALLALVTECGSAGGSGRSPSRSRARPTSGRPGVRARVRSPKHADSDSASSTSSMGPGGLDPTLRQQQHVGEADRDLLDVVGHQHVGGVAGSTARAVQRGDQLLAAAEVEAGCRLVEQQQPGRGHQRAGQQHALALARREQPEALVGHGGAAHRSRAGRGPGPGRRRRRCATTVRARRGGPSSRCRSG